MSIIYMFVSLIQIICPILNLLACPIDKNREDLRSGTWSTIRKARKHNLLIHLL